MPGQVPWEKLTPSVGFCFFLCEVTRSPWLISRATTSSYSDPVLSREVKAHPLSGQPHEETTWFSSLPENSTGSQYSSGKWTFALFSSSWSPLLSTKDAKNFRSCEGLGGGKVPSSTLCLKLGVKQCYPTFLRQDFPDPLTWSHLGDSLKEKAAFGVSQSIFRIDSFCCFVRAIGRACSLCFLTPETFHF